MPKYRQQKIDNYLDEKDKRLSLGAGLLLKYALKQCGIEGDLSIETKHNNKPYIAGKDIYFNLSHSGDKVMCVISSSEVGCDIEKIRNINLDIAKRYFFGSEYDLIKKQKSQKNKNDMFFRLWTLKESFMKVTGLGFRLSLSDFCIYFDGDTPKVKQNVSNTLYYFKEYNVFEDYKVSCSSTEDNFDNITMLDLSNLF